MRRLPPLNAIRAFEATARHLSFTKAARELCVTQGAVSRHVAALERALAAKLFLRHHRAIELTAKGEIYFRALRDAFERIQDATDHVAGVTDSPTLRVKLPPTFAIRWIVPRLARLHALDRSLDVQITTSHSPVDFGREEIDVAIHSGDEPPPGTIGARLFGEILTPVCSPALLRQGRALRQPGDLRRHTLLCSLHRPHDWPAWIEAAGVKGLDGNSGLKFENSSLAYQAAIDRLGIALAQTALVADDLETGRLVAPFSLRVPMRGAYFVVYPPRSRELEKVRRFVAWILEECAGMAPQAEGAGEARWQGMQ
ncbi:MAG: transcriptional regulator GcvA [Alphaproteobacteria bacterium]|nr:transcriptional regulator GcvA [Alphaproteobacteria bacterium]